MMALVQRTATEQTPEALGERLQGLPGVVVLRTGQFDSPLARYSLVAACPFLTFRSWGSRCEISAASGARPVTRVQFGDPWRLLSALMLRFELLEEIDLPFPLGGAFGFWGYDLKNFSEPKLPRRAINDLKLTDCQVGFYDSLVVFDHRLGAVSVISTGLDADGSRSEERAGERLAFWQELLSRRTPARTDTRASRPLDRVSLDVSVLRQSGTSLLGRPGRRTGVSSNLSRDGFIGAVRQAQDYIRAGDIYQVNLSHRLAAPWLAGGWAMFQALSTVSPAPFGAYLDCGTFEIASSSPEQFLRMSGRQIVTRPIKGTRPRDVETTRDAQLAYELQTSAKELSELVMITDLLRNDLGRVCEYGSVQVPDLARLEKFAQVQHLVSTVEGRLRAEVSHFDAFASCFPGGSITGAPKFRAMQMIDELEPLSRGPYCGAIGYLGFNRESQLSIAIRTAVCRAGIAYFNVGAGIVADSDPAAEYEETMAKGRGFRQAIQAAQIRFSSASM